jgi:archaellum component FlaF (FlaF/FlaG flagellin family)
MNNKTMIMKKMLALWAVCIMSCATVYGADVYLRTGIITNTMPDGSNVVMWAFAQDSAFGAGDGALTVPGPTLTVPPGDSNLTIHLDNRLPEAVSIVIPGQLSSVGPLPARSLADNRALSFTHEAAPGNLTAELYTWSNLAPGTHLYFSGSHSAVQVQMGLYGAVKRDAGTAGLAYTGVPYDAEVTLVVSEIDPALHDAVATGNYGPGLAMSSTVDYQAKYFLVNGASFTNGVAPVFAGRAGERILLRLLNASPSLRVMQLGGAYVALTAEDGYLSPYPRQSYSIVLPALKTVDAVLTAAAVQSFPIALANNAPSTTNTVVALFDRRLGLVAGNEIPGGMFTYLNVDNLQGWSLTADVQPTAGGTITTNPLPSPDGLYDDGTIVSLTAAPNAGYSLALWSGDASGTSTTVQVTMTKDMALTAHFIPTGATDSVPPSVTIITPTTLATYATTQSTINVGGTATDNFGVVRIVISNNRAISDFTGVGTANWQYLGVPLYSGTNIITVTAFDAASNSSTATLTVNYTGDTAYGDILRSGALIQQIVCPDNLIPGTTVTVQWAALSYVPVRSMMGSGSSVGPWTLFKNGQYTGSSNSTWNIGGRHATVYGFQCSYVVPDHVGDFWIWFNMAQMDGQQYMAAVIPDGVDPRPNLTQSKLIIRTILAGGTNLNPQSDIAYWDSANHFESTIQYEDRAGAAITYINMPDNVAPGQSVTCQWKILAYIPVNSKFSLLNLSQQQIWMTVTGSAVGTPVDSSWNFTDRSGNTYHAKEYSFQATFTVPNHTGTQEVYYLSQPIADPSASWMAGNIPAGVDSRPVIYQGMYGRFIDRTITGP